jgi:hypothetical protein
MFPRPNHTHMPLPTQHLHADLLRNRGYSQLLRAQRKASGTSQQPPANAGHPPLTALSSLDPRIREAAFSEAADCFAALVAKSEARLKLLKVRVVVALLLPGRCWDCPGDPYLSLPVSPGCRRTGLAGGNIGLAWALAGRTQRPIMDPVRRFQGSSSSTNPRCPDRGPHRQSDQPGSGNKLAPSPNLCVCGFQALASLWCAPAGAVEQWEQLAKPQLSVGEAAGERQLLVGRVALPVAKGHQQQLDIAAAAAQVRAGVPRSARPQGVDLGCLARTAVRELPYERTNFCYCSSSGVLRVLFLYGTSLRPRIVRTS